MTLLHLKSTHFWSLVLYNLQEQAEERLANFLFLSICFVFVSKLLPLLKQSVDERQRTQGCCYIMITS